MSTIQDQLPLVFETRNSCSFDTLVAGDNELAVGITRQCAQAVTGRSIEKQVLIWSEAGCGKSHLLQACCQLASAASRTVCYLPARQIGEYPPAVLDDLDRLDLVAIDDLDSLVHEHEWEVAWFDLINRCRESQTSLLISTSQAPEHIEIALPDLRSRLQWGPVFQLLPLSDDKKIIALQLRANLKGLKLDTRVAEFLLSRYPRDMRALFERLDQLDRASMASKRKLTIPFVKSIFD